MPGPDLMKKGYDLFFTKNRFKELKESKVVATGTLDKTNNLPKFNENDMLSKSATLNPTALKTNIDFMALHETFGHYNIKTICETLKNRCTR